MVISLYYREEFTMREVADVMDLAESRVSQIHSVAITKLRAAIQKMQIRRGHVPVTLWRSYPNQHPRICPAR